MFRRLNLSFITQSRQHIVIVLFLIGAILLGSIQDLDAQSLKMTGYQYDTYENFRACQSHFDHNGHDIAYIDQGIGPVILLIHGVPTSSWLYRKIIPVLVAGGYRVIAPDLLGYGSSSKPEAYAIYSPENQCRIIADLMDNIGVKSWTHVMHDVGGLWSWEMLKLLSDRVDRLVVLNTIIYDKGFNPPMRFEKDWKGKLYSKLYKSFLFGGMMMKGTLKNGMEDTKLSKAEIKGYRQPFREGSHKAIYHFFSNTCREIPDYSDLISSLKQPILVIWGANDDILVGADQIPQLRSDASCIKDVDVHTLTNCKHFIQEEDPQGVATLIGDFVSGSRQLN